MQNNNLFNQADKKSDVQPGGWVLSHTDGPDIVGIIQSISDTGLTFHRFGVANCAGLSSISIYLEGIPFCLRDLPCRFVSDRIQSELGDATLRLCKVEFEVLSSHQRSELERLLGNKKKYGQGVG